MFVHPIGGTGLKLLSVPAQLSVTGTVSGDLRWDIDMDKYSRSRR
jgi:hypothetical protein